MDDIQESQLEREIIGHEMWLDRVRIGGSRIVLKQRPCTYQCISSNCSITVYTYLAARILYAPQK